ncbi:MAG: DUF1822 family protein [Mojavia pulchra JT2-VF2]|jgi:hypothetical protein|uniref:DUF1822 family protein n=1 Tax=Mojavia pulchra JT2-VF2 TaxID=287848 RepID=A0A951Q753_9NOST|nr:DUF1822 family protein [Mojavia pulchra JT2-VF2]
MFNAFPAFEIECETILEIIQTSRAFNSTYSTAGGRQRAWVNQLCLNTFLTWLREEITLDARVYPSMAVLPSFWEVVNGTAITFDNLRLVLIPTLAMDVDELRVPQEWVDIPEWVADYYLAVQVNPDDGWMRIFGYTTHQKLKSIGVYDGSDRTYSLEYEDLIPDLNVLWITKQFTAEATRYELSPLAPLSQTQAENLLQRLGDADIKFPRLEVPFDFWGALLAHGGWRQRLYEMRQGFTQQASILQWLQDGISNFAQILGWEKQEFVPLPSGMRSLEPQAAIVRLTRQLLIAGNTYELRIFPKGNPEEQIWRFELRNSNSENLIPAGFKLKLLTEDLQPFINNEDIATVPVEMLFLEVMLEPGEGLVWEVEPLPEDYDREILRF